MKEYLLDINTQQMKSLVKNSLPDNVSLLYSRRLFFNLHIRKRKLEMNDSKSKTKYLR